MERFSDGQTRFWRAILESHGQPEILAKIEISDFSVGRSNHLPAKHFPNVWGG
jgi:hypothetical protein